MLKTQPTRPNIPAQTYQTKLTSLNLPNQNYQTKLKLANQAYWTRPDQTHQTKTKLLVKAVNAWVRSAFDKVFKYM